MASLGGGAYIDDTDEIAIITNSHFTQNEAQNGGGIFSNGSCSVNISKSFFNDNHGTVAAAVYMQNNGLSQINQSTFINHSISSDDSNDPSVIYIGGTDVDVGIRNSIFYYNDDKDIRINNSGYLILTYSNIENGEAGIHYDELGGFVYGTGNFDYDPMFCDPENGNYTLYINSPCTATGSNGVNVGAFDVGCEFQTCDTPAISSIEGQIDSPIENNLYGHGQLMNINWDYDGPGQCHLFLYNNNEYISTIATATINDGSYNWFVPSIYQNQIVTRL